MQKLNGKCYVHNISTSNPRWQVVNCCYFLISNIKTSIKKIKQPKYTGCYLLLLEGKKVNWVILSAFVVDVALLKLNWVILSAFVSS